MIYALIIAAMLFLPTPARALDIGTRMPIKFGEVFVVRNDGGIRNWSSYFPYGATCPVKWRLPMWLVVTRVVADRVLLTVDLNNQVAELSCPHGTETSMPYAQARNRYSPACGSGSTTGSGAVTSTWATDHVPLLPI